MMLPFDTQVCHEGQICLRFHQILNVILEMTFSVESWIEFLAPVLAKLRKIAFDAVAGSSDAWRLPTEFAGGVKLCSGAWKHGQDSHAAVFSLCLHFQFITSVSLKLLYLQQFD